MQRLRIPLWQQRYRVGLLSVSGSSKQTPAPPCVKVLALTQLQLIASVSAVQR